MIQRVDVGASTNQHLHHIDSVTAYDHQRYHGYSWYNYLRTIINKSQPNSLITLMFQSHHETFIRRSWYSVLPDLDVTVDRNKLNVSHKWKRVK